MVLCSAVNAIIVTRPSPTGNAQPIEIQICFNIASDVFDFRWCTVVSPKNWLSPCFAIGNKGDCEGDVCVGGYIRHITSGEIQLRPNVLFFELWLARLKCDVLAAFIGYSEDGKET